MNKNYKWVLCIVMFTLGLGVMAYLNNDLIMSKNFFVVSYFFGFSQAIWLGKIGLMEVLK